ncbi:MAG: hypothetical protein H7Z75_05445 [Ferruginibacter sp.]|nr:hypothetical protein [Cytophagales bacterium]
MKTNDLKNKTNARRIGYFILWSGIALNVAAGLWLEEPLRMTIKRVAVGLAFGGLAFRLLNTPAAEAKVDLFYWLSYLLAGLGLVWLVSVRPEWTDGTTVLLLVAAGFLLLWPWLLTWLGIRKKSSS